jgi:hydrogenase nickel incorporation protein HypA/HybF
MHEIRIAEDLRDIVLEVATGENLHSVSKVNICFGELIQIVPDIFEFAFRESSRNSIASSARISIEIIPVKFRCRKCSNEFVLIANNYACKECGSSETDIINGKEMYVKSIEGE